MPAVSMIATIAYTTVDRVSCFIVAKDARAEQAVTPLGLGQRGEGEEGELPQGSPGPCTANVSETDWQQNRVDPVNEGELYEDFTQTACNGRQTARNMNAAGAVFPARSMDLIFSAVPSRSENHNADDSVRVPGVYTGRKWHVAAILVTRAKRRPDRSRVS